MNKFTELVISTISRLSDRFPVDVVIDVDTDKERIELYCDKESACDFVCVSVGPVMDMLKMYYADTNIACSVKRGDSWSTEQCYVIEEDFCAAREVIQRKRGKYSIKRIGWSYLIGSNAIAADSFYIERAVFENYLTRLVFSVDDKEFLFFKNLSIFVSNENTKTV